MAEINASVAGPRLKAGPRRRQSRFQGCYNSARVVATVSWVDVGARATEKRHNVLCLGARASEERHNILLCGGNVLCRGDSKGFVLERGLVFGQCPPRARSLLRASMSRERTEKKRPCAMPETEFSSRAQGHNLTKANPRGPGSSLPGRPFGPLNAYLNRLFMLPQVVSWMGVLEQVTD